MVEYPVFTFEKDDRSMYLLESEERILYHLEAIDIENDEYVFWDAAGVGVRISVSVGAWKQKLESVSSCPAPFPLREAFEQYADSLGIIGLSVDGTPLEVWRRIQEQRKRSEGTIRRGTS